MLENRLIETLNLRDLEVSLGRIAEKLGLSKKTIRTWDAYINTWERYNKEPLRPMINSVIEDTALKILASNYREHERRQNYLARKGY